MKTYKVEIAVLGFYNTTIVAENEEEAKEKAILEADNADFGLLENIDYDDINVEEEKEYEFKVEYKYTDVFKIKAPTKEAAELFLNQELSCGRLCPEDNGDFESTVELLHEEY